MTKTQKKIILAAAIVTSVFLIFCFFIYVPGKKQISNLRQELMGKQKEIDDIQAIVSQGDSLEQSIARLKEKCTLLEGKFPLKEEDTLGAISDLARKAKINLASVSPSPKKIVVDENQKNLTLDGKACQSLSVIISFDCSYRDLVKYIELLKEDLPSFAIVESLEANKNNSGTGRDLTVRLGLIFYVLS